jgi:aspartate 1-decarboxylase
MLLELCRAKIHRAVVTVTDPDYEGSLTVPREVMASAGVLPYEKVQVANLSNGTRLENYVIPGDEPCRFCLNGAAALHAKPGDVILAIFYDHFDPSEAAKFAPTVVLMNPDNSVKRVIKGSAGKNII